MRPPTGWFNVVETPSSPRAMPPIQERYCTASGRSRPSRSRIAARASGVAFSPRIATAASPGRRCVQAKMISDRIASESAP
jgi:hypothetical protein